jgi:hypothetical protein
MPPVSPEAKARAREYRKAWQKANPEKMAGYAEKYLSENYEKIKERKRLQNRERNRIYREKNRDRYNDRMKKWRVDHPDYWLEQYLKHRASIMCRGAKVRARKAGIPFNIDISDVVIPERCPVLGIKIECATTGGFKSGTAPSLDKIIPELGYIKGNVRVISHRANMLKRDGTAEELMKIAIWVASETARVRAETSAQQ